MQFFCPLVTPNCMFYCFVMCVLANKYSTIQYNYTTPMLQMSGRPNHHHQYKPLDETSAAAEVAATKDKDADVKKGCTRCVLGSVQLDFRHF